MDKFQRNFIMQIQGGDGKTYTFRYPTTLEFHIESRALASANTGSFRLYNLNGNTRKVIYKDYFDIEGPNSLRLVTLMAGYGDNLSQVFYGNIKEAQSFRDEGSVNFITSIDCYDWSFAMVNAISKDTLGPPSYPLSLARSTVIERLVDDLTKVGVTKGVINKEGFDLGGPPYLKAYTPAASYDGNTWEALKHETNDHCFISNGTVHCMLDDDCFEGDTALIDSSTGLLSTPKKCRNLLKVDILFEPSIKLGQRVELLSQSEPLYNGPYKVIGIEHHGIISGAVGGKCRTSLLLNAGEFQLNVLTEELERVPIGL
jgi:hypothetical protein